MEWISSLFLTGYGQRSRTFFFNTCIKKNFGFWPINVKIILKTKTRLNRHGYLSGSSQNYGKLKEFRGILKTYAEERGMMQWWQTNNLAAANGLRPRKHKITLWRKLSQLIRNNNLVQTSRGVMAHHSDRVFDPVTGLTKVVNESEGDLVIGNSYSKSHI